MKIDFVLTIFINILVTGPWEIVHFFNLKSFVPRDSRLESQKSIGKKYSWNPNIYYINDLQSQEFSKTFFLVDSFGTLNFFKSL